MKSLESSRNQFFIESRSLAVLWKVAGSKTSYDAILLVQGRAGISLDNLAWLWDNDDKHEYLHSIYYVPGLVQNTF